MSGPLPSSSGAGGKRGHDEMEGIEGTSLNSQVPATSERASMEVIEAQRLQIQEVEEKLHHKDKRHRQEVAALHNPIGELTKLVRNGNGDRTDEETTSVFQLLPENWDYILPYLNPTDFQTLINSTPRFRTLFKSERADKLLPSSLALIRLGNMFIDTIEVDDMKPLNADHSTCAIGRLAGKGVRTKFTIENATKSRIVLAGRLESTFLEHLKTGVDQTCGL